MREIPDFYDRKSGGNQGVDGTEVTVDLLWRFKAQSR